LVAGATLMAMPAAHGINPDDAPQWPNLPNEVSGRKLPASDTPFPTDPARPASIDRMPERIRNIQNPQLDLGVLGAGARDRAVSPDVTGGTARWPDLPSEAPPSPWGFETGLRYWYSTSSMRFAFTNGNPQFGSPTSTLGWHWLSAHSGEAFARLDHKPSGIFVKGVFGLGAMHGGLIDDLDFFVGDVKFSDTTSEVKEGNMMFGSADLGWSYWPSPELRLGVFAGYQHWREKTTAYGLICNPTDILPPLCSPGDVLAGPNTAVFVYEPSWHAARIGFEGRYTFYERWTFDLEVAAIPYAALQNKDSHLLRQDMTDLGPVPNVLMDSTYAYGVQAEAFISYALTPNLAIGAGLRGWGLTSQKGHVHFGPTFSGSFPLDHFEHMRWGGLVQIKGRF
jgi:hypothetical protein